MTTEETVLYSESLIFSVVGSEDEKTEAYEFIKNDLTLDEWKRILGTLGAINTELIRYNHREKFKRVEGKIYEIKQFQIRIACYWRDGRTLVAFMAFRKKSDDWPKAKLQKARDLLLECQKNDMTRM